MVRIKKSENRYQVSFYETNRFNCFEVEELMKFIPEFLSTPECELCINLEQITFIDTCGMDFLISLAFKSQEHKLRFRLCQVSDEVKELLVKTDLADQILEYAQVISNEPCQ